MKPKDRKKKLLIEAGVIALVIVIFAVVVLVDTFKFKNTYSLTEQEAQTILSQTIELIPKKQAQTANGIIDRTHFTVKSVEPGEERVQILHCDYETIDVLGLYNQYKDIWFSEAYAYYSRETDNTMVNSAKIRQEMDSKLLSKLEEAESITGSIDILVYELQNKPKGDAYVISYADTFFRVHLSDETLNGILGGIIAVTDDIKSTKTVQNDGQTVDIANTNTIRTGLTECFGLNNFSSAKPDASPYFLSLWNDFCKDFYLNFIKDAKWSYLAKGLITTLEITLLAALLGVVLGFVCAIIRVTHDKTGKLMIPDQIVRAYLAIIRGTPVMIQLLIIYFVVLLPAGVAKFPSAVICFALNSGAYVAEIVRGGIMSVDNGQVEAGRSLGLNYIQTMYHIVVPQAFKAVLPSLANEFITLLKESSVAFYIGVADLTQGGLKIRSITYSNFMPLIAVAVIYFIIVMILTKLVKILERRLRKDER